MKKHIFSLSVLAAALALAPGLQAQQASQPGKKRISFEPTFEKVKPGAWTGKRVAGGQPDVEGHWSNSVGNHNNWTDPQGNIPHDPNPRQLKTTREQRAPSRVSDPADGQVPFQPWAKAKQEEFVKHFHNPVQPQFIEPLARCAPAGVPKSFIWHGYEIRQYPGYLVFLFGSGTRIIHIEDKAHPAKPHLHPSVKLWNADSRGRWEGNTLIVDVANNNGKALFGRTGEFASENVHITERYTFSNDGKNYTYEATFDDPSVYTRKWTATIPAKRRTSENATDGWHFEVAYNKANGKEVIERHEQVCVENNNGFGNVAVTPAR